MAYPVDDKGNIRVDFVWGNVPMQPDEQRGNNYDDNEYTVEGGWATKELVGNEALQTGWDTITRRNGDQSDDGNVRYDIVEYGVHDIAATGYSNYPAFLPNYAGDDDTALEFAIPDIRGLTRTAARAAIEALGLNFTDAWTYVGATVANDNTIKLQDQAAGSYLSVGDSVTASYYRAPEVPLFLGLTNTASTFENSGVVLGTVTTSADGATALNNGQVKSQSPTFGTKVNAGSAVNLVTYNYVAPAGPNYNIAGIRPAIGIGDTGRTLYLTGAPSTHGLAFNDLITLSGTGVTNYNRQFTVFEVWPDNAFNTGGTRVVITNPSMDGTGGDVTNVGTYTKP
jgi:hypothetical protein